MGGWRPQAKRQSPRDYSVVANLSAVLATLSCCRLQHVLVPLLGCITLILIIGPVVRRFPPLPPQPSSPRCPRHRVRSRRHSPCRGWTCEVRKASPSTDAPPGFTILVATAPREPLPPVAENIAGMIGTANPLPSPGRAPGFSILVDVSLPAPLPPFPKSVAGLIAITSPLTKLPNQLKAAKPAPRASIAEKHKPRPKAKSAQRPKEAYRWTRLPWLAQP